MGIKKRSKVSAQFNMSSLTDIIFLLLIFFMLTSTLVAPNALNLKLPGSSNRQSVTASEIDDVTIRKDGRYYFNSKRIDIGELETQLSRNARSAGSRKYNMTISPEKGTPTEYVVAVMDMAMRFNINGILATEKD